MSQIASDWSQELETLRPRLRRMVELRLDKRIRRRVDPSDVIQEAMVEAMRRRDEFSQQSTMPLYLWIRLLAIDRLIMLHRRHLGAKARDVGREIALDGAPGATSAVLAGELAGQLAGPSEAAIRAERQAAIFAALESMESIDREILALVHFEQMTMSESAQALGITLAAVKKRHVRALKRLRSVIENSSGIEP